MTKEYLTKKEMGDYIGISMGKVENLMYEKKIPYIKFGRNVRFDISDIKAYMHSNKV